MKQCTEAPSDIKHASVKAQVCFQGSVKYRRVDRTAWNHNTLPLLVTQERLEQYQTAFAVYQLNKMYTCTFTFARRQKLDI